MVDNSQYYYSERKFKQLKEPFSFSFFCEKVNKYSQLYCSKRFDISDFTRVFTFKFLSTPKRRQQDQMV